jgi:hypothetical protein
MIRVLRKIASVILWTVFVFSAGSFILGYLVLNVGHFPAIFEVTMAMFAAHWIATMAACALVIAWSFSSSHRWFWFGMILSLLALASSSWGLACIRITTTRMTNGKFQTQFDSNWFFTTSLVLALLASAFTLWQRWRWRGERLNKPPHATATAPPTWLVH